MLFDLKDVENMQSLLAKYFFDFEQALSTKDFSKADESLERLKNFQNFYRANLIPASTQISLELF